MFILFLVFLNAFFVIAEYSLSRIRRGQLQEMKEQKVAGADTLLHVFDKRNQYISATQIGVTCTSLILGWYGGPLLAKWLRQLPWVQQWLKSAKEADKMLSFEWFPADFEVSTFSVCCAFLILAMLHVVVGELVPRIIVWNSVETVIQYMGKPLRCIYILTYPFVSIAFCLAKGITRLFGIRYTPKEDISRSEEELRQIVSASEQEGELDSAERAMINNVFEFNDTLAREVMIPRQDMICIYVDDSVEEIRQVIQSNHHTRFPLCEEDKDHVLGVLHVRDLYSANLTSDLDVRTLARKTIAVPESMTAVHVLQTLQKQRVHLAVVVDEFGGTVGLVTLEDLLEEIVGEISDEYAPIEIPDFVKVAPGIFDIDADVTLDEVERELAVSFEENEDDTLGGYIFSRLGRKPEEGDELRKQDWLFTVKSMDQFRIERIIAKNIKIE
ncbi:MAG: HlyC/CorC family transporter [Acidaminococcaceae bacterium]|nr:HlyC/CorC family transporter [Acidaminococcaceae bacterium]